MRHSVQQLTSRFFFLTAFLCVTTSALTQTCGPFTSISSTCIAYHVAAIKTDGTLWTWGNNFSGQLGNGSTFQRGAPGQVGTASNWMTAVTGGRHTLAIKTDSSLWAWGENSSGQLGDGTLLNKSTPVQIASGIKWKTVRAGRNHNLAVRSDGTLWAWGANNRGQLGDGTNTSRLTPTQIGTDTNWAILCCGVDYTLAIKTDGSLWGWGSNDYGNLGDGTAGTDRYSQVQIVPGTSWKAIACGQFSSMGIKTNGTLWGWGANGLLGDGTNISQASPVQAGTASNWKAVSNGGGHSIGLRTDGTLWAWGDNGINQLGDGTNTDRLSPVPIGAGIEWAYTGAGTAGSSAISTNGTLYTWGSNIQGESGNGYGPVTSIPIPISSNINLSIAMLNSQQTLPVALSTTFFNSATCTDLITTVTPSGSTPISGNTTARVWIENSQPADIVKRHYQILPAVNPDSVTANLTLYFTQAEFDAFNTVNTVKLPSGPTDVTGKSNLRIEKRNGASTDNTGMPYSYNGHAAFIDPADSAITWNSAQFRWEITIPVAGFGGFFVGTSQRLQLNNCPGRTYSISTGITGTVYQWQADTGNGFTDIAADAVYTGTGTPTLSINGLSSSFAGIKYRCVTDGVPGPAYTVSFTLRWLGTTNTDWFTGSNWSGCGAVPDSKTDVIIPSGRLNYPVVTASTSIRSLTNENGASVTVQNGAVLSITR